MKEEIGFGTSQSCLAEAIGEAGDAGQHTPGPWEWTIHDHSMATLAVGDYPGEGAAQVLTVSPCDPCIGRSEGVWKWGRCGTPSEADALLISKAPDLLKELATCTAFLVGLAMRDVREGRLATGEAVMERAEKAAALVRATLGKPA